MTAETAPVSSRVGVFMCGRGVDAAGGSDAIGEEEGDGGAAVGCAMIRLLVCTGPASVIAWLG